MARFRVWGLAGAVALVLTACAGGATVLMSRAVHTVADASRPAAASPGVITQSVSPQRWLRPGPATAPLAAHSVAPSEAAAHPQYIAVTDAGATTTVRILDTSGHVLASATIDPVVPWAVATGPRGAYWIEDGAVHELGVNGSIRIVATVPDAAQELLVSPDGSELAYATSTPVAPGSDVNENRIYVQEFGGPPRLIADRLSDPAHPAADAPPSWDYYLVAWTSKGIVFARAPQGGCGCGAFDMEMQSADSAVVDTVTGATTELTQDAECPLAGVGADASPVCFQMHVGSSGVWALRVTRGGTAVTVPMSGSNDAGDALLSTGGGEVAYVTLPVQDDQCGGPWATTLRIMTLATGDASAVRIDDLTLSAWMDDGLLLGEVDGNTPAAVIVDPATMQERTIWAGNATHVVGLVG